MEMGLFPLEARQESGALWEWWGLSWRLVAKDTEATKVVDVAAFDVLILSLALSDFLMLDFGEFGCSLKVP